MLNRRQESFPSLVVVPLFFPFPFPLPPPLSPVWRLMGRSYSLCGGGTDEEGPPELLGRTCMSLDAVAYSTDFVDRVFEPPTLAVDQLENAIPENPIRLPRFEQVGGPQAQLGIDLLGVGREEFVVESTQTPQMSRSTERDCNPPFLQHFDSPPGAGGEFPIGYFQRIFEAHV